MHLWRKAVEDVPERHTTLLQGHLQEWHLTDHPVLEDEACLPHEGSTFYNLGRAWSLAKEAVVFVLYNLVRDESLANLIERAALTGGRLVKLGMKLTQVQQQRLTDIH